MTRTASHSRLLSLGSCMSAAVTVLSSRTIAAVFQSSACLAPAQQRPIDLFPGLGPDRADRLLQHRLLWAPRPRQPGKGSKRCRVLEMEGQLLVAQLAVLLEKRAAQHRLGRQPCRPVCLDPVPTQIARHQPSRSRCSSSHCDIAFSSWPISCAAKRSNMLAWTVRSWRIVGSGGGGFLWNQWLDTKVYLKPPGSTREKSQFYPITFNSLAFVDGN